MSMCCAPQSCVLRTSGLGGVRLWRPWSWRRTSSRRAAWTPDFVRTRKNFKPLQEVHFQISASVLIAALRCESMRPSLVQGELARRRVAVTQLKQVKGCIPTSLRATPQTMVPPVRLLVVSWFVLVRTFLTWSGMPQLCIWLTLLASASIAAWRWLVLFAILHSQPAETEDFPIVAAALIGWFAGVSSVLCCLI